MVPPPVVLVIMGVSGSGKSTVGGALAARLGWDFQEGDLLHPEANIVKMSAGVPLDDADRAPWLAEVAAWIGAHVTAQRPGVITCSALKRAYRDRLRGDHVVFVHLSAPREVLAARLRQRTEHYMPASLLGSQLDALEPPAPGEAVVEIPAGGGPAAIVDDIVARLSL